MVDAAAPGGGYIFCTGEGITHDTPPANMTAMVRAVRAHGGYRGGESMSVSGMDKKRLCGAMLLIRRFEEKVKLLYNEEKTIDGAIHLYIGQEAVAVGVCAVLRKDDYIFSTHRGHGHAIAKGAEIKGIMAELMGRDTGLSRGHGGSMHLFSTGHRPHGGQRDRGRRHPAGPRRGVQRAVRRDRPVSR